MLYFKSIQNKLNILDQIFYLEIIFQDNTEYLFTDIDCYI